ALARAFDRGAFATAAELVGVARTLVEMTVAYVKLRQQFGKAVGSFQAVKHQLAEAHVGIELARPCVHRAACALARREPDHAIHVSMAKAYASDAATRAARAALQCHGAIGYSFEYDLHLWMKRAWVQAAAYGDAAWHRARIGASLV
ncbi:MAG: acyl-CoA dehydrogenase, partial [Deltaproteobacteria bacterium]|nr:acyl-CoA dehydrogenase [Kofleriaceae bacterium]